MSPVAGLIASLSCEAGTGARNAAHGPSINVQTTKAIRRFKQGHKLCEDSDGAGVRPHKRQQVGAGTGTLTIL